MIKIKLYLISRSYDVYYSFVYHNFISQNMIAKMYLNWSEMQKKKLWI